MMNPERGRVAPHTGPRISFKGSRRRPSGSAAGVGTKRVSRPQSVRAEYRTQTADDGLYRFRGLPSGRHQLSVAAPPGRRALWEGNAENPGAGPGVPCAMNFEVFWGGLITGTVIGRDGQPASGMI